MKDLILRMFFLIQQYLTIKINVDEWSLYKGKESNDFETESISYIQKTLSRDLFEDELLRLNKILPSVQERIESMVDIAAQVMFLLDEPYEANSRTIRIQKSSRISF